MTKSINTPKPPKSKRQTPPPATSKAAQPIAPIAESPVVKISRVDSDHLVVPTAAPPRNTRAARTHSQISSVLDSSKRAMNALWGWPLFWLTMLLGVGFTAVGALAWLFSMPPVPECDRPELLVSDRERLQCAQMQAESGELRDIERAINLVTSWPEDHPLQREGEHLIERWSAEIVDIANQAADSGQLDRALDLLDRIPNDSPSYAIAQDLRLQWEQSWREGTAIFDRVLAALKSQNWGEAEYQADQLAFMTDYYWSEVRYKDATTRIAAEKEGRRKLKQAKQLVKEANDDPQAVYSALESIGQVDRETYARAASVPEINEWSKKLLTWAIGRKREDRIEEALAAAKIIPQEAELYPRARDLVALSQAELMIGRDFSPLSIPLNEQILLIMDAQAVTAEMSPKHPLYRSSQALLSPWKLYLEDLLQLQIATGVASLGQPVSFRLAIAQAEEIERERPGRIYAQTLISGWKRELERIEDKPLIERARALARLNTIDGYKAAIAQAEKLSRDRGSWVDAEALIAWCQRQIEAVEDQPIIDRARQLIVDGKTDDAIALLKQISSGRALYDDARQLIRELGQRELIERDRPILERAMQLAKDGKLTEAINIADDIPKDSPLYREAQDKITRWVRDRGGRANPGGTGADAFDPDQRNDEMRDDRDAATPAAPRSAEPAITPNNTPTPNLPPPSNPEPITPESIAPADTKEPISPEPVTPEPIDPPAPPPMMPPAAPTTDIAPAAEPTE
ncbi:MAG: hypothetical protein HC795_07690 [Coleofasciculaceae cyanobacterium RL_1_1]|nr:hypothetical protein [Coleofasciculaceae cyanobacterium RL_1_1]